MPATTRIRLADTIHNPITDADEAAAFDLELGNEFALPLDLMSDGEVIDFLTLPPLPEEDDADVQRERTEGLRRRMAA